MNEIIRNRTIRPSTRLEKSKSYKIDTRDVTKNDILTVNIDHESKPFKKTFKFTGIDVAYKNSISFRVNDNGTNIGINWSGAKPIATEGIKGLSEEQNMKPNIKLPINESYFNENTNNLKQSLDPISDDKIEILILGTMPGDTSLKTGEYYAHSRNKFWKTISKITESEVPEKYSDKKAWLLNSKIGVWDVAQKVLRKGSLDSSIKNEVPNVLDAFIVKHNYLKVIGFNGKKSEALYDKHFKRSKSIKYISLPSTSPANTGIDFEKMCATWKQIFQS